jgi:methionyl-tRNA synthetase
MGVRGSGKSHCEPILLEANRLQAALQSSEFDHSCESKIDQTAPFKLAKDQDKRRLDEVLTTRICRILGVLLGHSPKTACNIYSQLGLANSPDQTKPPPGAGSPPDT